MKGLPFWNVRVKFLAFGLALGLSVPSHAQEAAVVSADPSETILTEWTPPPPPAPPTHLERQTLRLEVLEGAAAPKALPLVMKKGWLNAQLPTYSELGLRLTNMGEGRLLVVVAINGLDPSSGKKAYQGQPGQVLLPGQAIVINQGKTHKKAPLGPVLPASRAEGTISVAVFHERTDYPLLLPGMTPPPFGAEAFKVGKDGVRRWVPPLRYPFRKLTPDPAEFLYLQYSAALVP